MPPIIYGTAWKKERTASLVAAAIQAGFRGIDTACQPKHYDEPGVGEGIAAALSGGIDRSDLFLQTKFTPLGGHDPMRIPYDAKASLPVQVKQSFERSLHNLRTTWLDSLLLHSPLADFDQTLEVWRELERIVEAGGACRIGISNCYDLATLKRLHEVARIRPAVLQNRFYAETHYDRAIRAFCREHDIVYQSFWTLTANPQLLASDAVVAMAKQHGCTPAQILFRYLSLAGVVPLTGTRSPTHMREDLAIGTIALDVQECAAIDSLLDASADRSRSP